ncbi:MAG TPA: hypothetical protein VFV38_08405 [Ktedonobacteraceae bacterium]|nr:hypothetical protein [Ktedonobacteraceae bacterium]
MIVKNRYVKRRPVQSQQHIRKLLNAHVKYIEHRSREVGETPESRALFDAERDRVGREEVVNDVMSHTSPGVSYHKLVLSPADNEPVTDWREWTREVMADLEDHQGKDLHWYAVHHDNTDHGHVHVILAGQGEDRASGQATPIGLYEKRGDFRALIESGREHSDYDHYQQIQEINRQLNEQDTVGHEPVARDVEHDFSR